MHGFIFFFKLNFLSRHGKPSYPVNDVNYVYRQGMNTLGYLGFTL